ncbi:MAG: AAA family ATPase [Vicinamibacterales bacterium]
MAEPLLPATRSFDYSTASKPFTAVRLGVDHPVTVLVPAPDAIVERPFIGRESLMRNCRAAWFAAGDAPPLHFRLIGPPGVGKNELVYALAREEGRPLYILQGHDELTPEDIACTARIVGDGRVEYVGSPLLAAMLAGGICFVDEIGKIPPRALSLLSSVLDNRRSLTSVLAGFTVSAHPSFRFCAAMNDADASSSGLPGYIDERLRPLFRVGYPTATDLIAIVEARAAHAGEHLLDDFKRWMALQATPLSPRQALQIVSFAARLLEQSGPAHAGDVIERSAHLVRGSSPGGTDDAAR